MYTGVNLFRAPGKDMPEEFLDICSGEKSDVIGGALAVNGNLLTVKLDGSQLQAVKDTCAKEDYKACGLLLHFGNEDTDNDVPEESQQPFIPLFGANDVKLGACVIDGVFSGYGAANSSQTTEYWVHEEYIAPKLKDLYESVGDDLDKLVAKLRTPMITREILAGSNMGDRGCIALLFANGEICIFTKNPKHSNFTWGWASQRFAYDKDLLTNTTSVPEVKAPATPTDMFGAPAAPKASAAPAPAPAAAAPIPAAPGTGPQPDVSPGKDATILIYYPSEIAKGSNKGKKNWLARFIGANPPDWNQAKPGPWPLKAAHHHALQDLIQRGHIVLAGQPSPAAAAAPEKSAPVAAVNPVIIDTETRKRIENIFSPIILGTLDTANQYIADPSRIEAETGKVGSFLTQMGWPDKAMKDKGVPEGWDFWYRHGTLLFLEQFIRTDIKTAAKVMQEFIVQDHKNRMALKEAAKIKAA
jgi:hypothetical protein